MSSSDDTPTEEPSISKVLSDCLRSGRLAQEKRSSAGMVVVGQPYGAYPPQPYGMYPPPVVAQPMIHPYGAYPGPPMVVQPMMEPMFPPPIEPMAMHPPMVEPMLMPAPPMVTPMAAPPMVPTPMMAPQPMPRPAPVWMPPPGAIPGCPAGLEYLTLVDQVIVEQLIEILEVFTGIETANRYIIRNSAGQQVYYAMELSTQGQRSYKGAWRAFTMRLMDNVMREVIRVHRPEQPCCSNAEAYIEAPPGSPIGYIKGTFEGFRIYDPIRVPFLSLIQPGFIDKNTQTVFMIQSATGEPIGMMIKHYGGAMKESMTNADTFSLQFPKDLTAQMKAVLLACVFMVDFRHFEDKHSSNLY